MIKVEGWVEFDNGDIGQFGSEWSDELIEAALSDRKEAIHWIGQDIVAIIRAINKQRAEARRNDTMEDQTR